MNDEVIGQWSRRDAEENGGSPIRGNVPMAVVWSGWEKPQNIYRWCQKKKYIALHVKCPIFYPILTKFEFSPQIILKISNVKFNKNPSSGSCKDTNIWTERHDEAYMHFLGLVRPHIKILHPVQVAYLRILYESKKNRDYFPVNN